MNFLSPCLFCFCKIGSPVSFICSSPSLQRTHICSMLFIVCSSIALCLFFFLQSWVAEVTSFWIGGVRETAVSSPTGSLSQQCHKTDSDFSKSHWNHIIYTVLGKTRRSTEWKLQQKNIQRLSITSLHAWFFFFQSMQKCRQTSSCSPGQKRIVQFDSLQHWRLWPWSGVHHVATACCAGEPKWSQSNHLHYYRYQTRVRQGKQEVHW